jgi:hypothetical protein
MGTVPTEDKRFFPNLCFLSFAVSPFFPHKKINQLTGKKSVGTGTISVHNSKNIRKDFQNRKYEQ